MSGGSSGNIAWPDYLQVIHEHQIEWVEDLTDAARTGGYLSPYDSEVAYDPDNYINAIQNSFTNYNGKVTGIDYDADWEGIMDTVRAKLDDGTTFPAITNDVATIVSNSITNIGSEVADAISDARTNGLNIISDVDGAVATDISNIVSSAVTKALSDIDSLMSQGDTDVVDTIDTAFAAAIVAATSAMSGTYIDDAVDAYEEDIKPQYFRAVNRFTGGMVDINAVHTTSFIMGLAIMEKGFTNDVNKFRAELEKETYNQGISIYMNAFSNALNGYLTGYANELTQYLSLYSSTIPSGRATLAGLFDRQVAEFSNLYNGYLSGFITTRKDRDLTLAQSMQTMVGMRFQEVQAYAARTALLADINRSAIVAKMEEKNKNLEIDVLDADWDYDIYNKWGILAGALNGAPTVPKGPTQLQSALGTGFSTASMAAQMSGGNPFATGGGFAIGAIVGALSY